MHLCLSVCAYASSFQRESSALKRSREIPRGEMVLGRCGCGSYTVPLPHTAHTPKSGVTHTHHHSPTRITSHAAQSVARQAARSPRPSGSERSRLQCRLRHPRTPTHHHAAACFSCAARRATPSRPWRARRADGMRRGGQAEAAVWRRGGDRGVELSNVKS